MIESNTKFIFVPWPEVQQYMEDERFEEESILYNKEGFQGDYLLSESFYEEVKEKLEEEAKEEARKEKQAKLILKNCRNQMIKEGVVFVDKEKAFILFRNDVAIYKLSEEGLVDEMVGKREEILESEMNLFAILPEKYQKVYFLKG